MKGHKLVMQKILVCLGAMVLGVVSQATFANTDNQQKTIPNNPVRVASMDLGVVDTLEEIGSSVRFLPKQGLPNYLTKYKAKKYADLGDFKRPNMVKLKKLKPDLIIISSKQQAIYDEFAKVAPTINLSINPRDYESSFKNNMLLIGKVFNKLPEMSIKLTELGNKIKQVQQTIAESPDKALVVVYYNGHFMTSDYNNYTGLIHDWLGVKRVDLSDIQNKSKKNIQTLSTKQIAALNPDILFIIDRNEAVGEGKVNRQQLEDNYIKQTKAYKENKVVYLNPDLWYFSGNGLRSTALQVKEVEKPFLAQ